MQMYMRIRGKCIQITDNQGMPVEQLTTALKLCLNRATVIHICSIGGQLFLNLSDRRQIKRCHQIIANKS